jgi:hypothetical protein
MEEQNKVISEAIKEIKEADEVQLKELIEEWYEKIHTQSMKLGAQFISAAVYGVIEKNLKKKAKSSLRDYQRCVDGILKIISVQLTQQNDLNEDNTSKEIDNNG